MGDYELVNNFNEILEKAKGIVSEGNTLMNFNLKVQFNIDLTKEVQLLDVIEEAEQWQSVKRPENLHFSHGEYIGEEGFNHLITELKNKRDSNRAVISLLGQEQINNTGDNPIPSFMILQASLIGGELYVTTYFRALELCNFLPINLEEIRMIINRINREVVDIHAIKLNLLAFRAYKNPEQNTLKRYDLDVLNHEILVYMQSEPKKILGLLRDKLQESTVTENKGFKNLLDIIEKDTINKDIHDCFKLPLIIQSLHICINKSSELSKQRSLASHSQIIKDLNTEIKRNLKIIIDELERNLH